MELPGIKKTESEDIYIKSFKGLGCYEGAEPDRFRNLLNMTGESYPAMSSRASRRTVDTGGDRVYNIAALDILYDGKIIKDALVTYTGNRLKAYFDGGSGFSFHTLMATSGAMTEGEKQLVVSGTRLYFFPDGFCVDLMNTNDRFLLGYTRSQGLGSDGEYYYELCLTRCDADGNADENGEYGKVECCCYNLNSDGTKGTLREKMSVNAAIKPNDTVEIKGFGNKALDGWYNIATIDRERLYYIIKCPYSSTANVGEYRISRKIPSMDYIIACQGRLWGCRYGLDEGGKSVNEIYASALGDPTNWYRYDGKNSDSWCGEISTGGAFTGAAVLGGRPIFFKEDAVIKIFGSRPGDFTVTETKNLGAETGSGNSIVYADNGLYYKSLNGIVRYDGTLPKKLSQVLGSAKYTDAIAEMLDSKYYVSMKSAGGERRLYVYDTVRGIWNVEDDPGIKAMCRCGRTLYMLCSDGESSRILASGDVLDGAVEEKQPWSFETVDIWRKRSDGKYVAAVSLDMSLDIGASAEIQISYDGERCRYTEEVLRGVGDTITSVKIRPGRCNYFRIRVSGRGNVCLKSFIIHTEKYRETV